MICKGKFLRGKLLREKFGLPFGCEESTDVIFWVLEIVQRFHSLFSSQLVQVVVSVETHGISIFQEPLHSFIPIFVVFRINRKIF